MPCPSDICLFVLGGRAPASFWLKSLDFQSDVWAVDKGIEPCFECGIMPSRLIGDKDSASVFEWDKAKTLGIPVFEHPKDKDLTDFQLALNMYSNEYTNGAVFLTGALGGRFDHLFSTVITFLSCPSHVVPLGIADEKEGIVFLRGSSYADFFFENMPEAVSLISFSEQCTGVSTEGLKWPLGNAVLEYSNPYSVSNEVCALAKDGHVKVSLAEGTLCVYWKNKC